MEVHNVTAEAETFTCNAYLAVGGDGTATLVDAGAMPGVEDVVASHVEELDSVVVTHQHGDHVAELGAVLDRFDADLYAYADHPRRTHELSDGDVVTVGDEDCEVVYTPGHADDHVSLLGESSLFSGDVVVHDDGAFDYGSFGRTDRPDQSRERLIESLQRLLDRFPEGVEHMYAGHGGVFHGDVRDVVETALGRAEKRQPKYPDE
ncbi:MBL fold metallo-hydrolase [Halapricum sp. CBA1109]|uniref:MBL fold metallo-hydrolase n=1 Tax=Halapricum sp. CBA1109 TaxID=2668068 RepID=UPI0012F7498C|nr:MBL fold metallo-hydrolase [Halapricum sp. CBA1109]MUV88946.1 MBL fold metallo-hydrolase [Halapricum sp. CBA1109]